jgi:hypothetical protein
LNSITHYLDQFVQLLEDTRLDYTKYRAALMLHSIFFTNRIHDIWNELPGSVVDSESVAVFNKRLHGVDLSVRLRYILTLFPFDFS